MIAKIFEYKGGIAAISDPSKYEELLNNLSTGSHMGIVMKTEDVGITEEAMKRLKKARREAGSFAAIMLTKHDPSIHEIAGKSSLCLFGFENHLFCGDDLCIGRTCDLSALDDVEVITLEPEELEGFQSIITLAFDELN